MTTDRYRVGSFEFSSRLFVGTGKYADFEEMNDSLSAAQCEVVTVAIRRDVMAAEGGTKPGNILEHLDVNRYTILPNTAGCFTAKDAVRSAKLGRELLEGLGNAGAKWVKLEVLADKKTLLPDVGGTLQATKELVDLFVKSKLQYISTPTFDVLVDVFIDVSMGALGGLAAWWWRRRARA